MSQDTTFEDIATRPSERFQADDADVSFRSIDGVLFRIHRKNLEAHAAGFAPPGFDTMDEVVPLTEKAGILELLFQFVYLGRYPDLESTPFDILAPLAEAAEKYEVFSAINICKARMKNTLPDHPEEIMLYAAKHGYNDIIGEAAPLLLSIPVDEMVLKLPRYLTIPWVRYYESWNRILRAAISGHTRIRFRLQTSWYDNGNARFMQTTKLCAIPSCYCHVGSVTCDILGKLKDVQSLQNLDAVFSGGTCCSHIAADIYSWRISVEREIQFLKPLLHYM